MTTVEPKLPVLDALLAVAAASAQHMAVRRETTDPAVREFAVELVAEALHLLRTLSPALYALFGSEEGEWLRDLRQLQQVALLTA